MALGGYMHNVIKYNQSLRLDKSKHFKKTLGGYNLKSENEKVTYEKPSKVYLKRLKRKLKREQELREFKIGMVFIVGFTLMCSLFVYFMF
ncbi:hypothetical protein [Mangrovimonas sp. TPBH4]|uniref:hypothetical protein n=1 Tax=Mangrovimonas sp. TPBH4 TaxID=1645914 RepID=UPI0006B41955|nr:hypothetical protein [Mangrovimonas sp. TPBH4]